MTARSVAVALFRASTRRARRRATPIATATVHLVEPGGRGGVWQHTVEVAVAAQRHGRTVVVHTCADYEDLGADVEICSCFSWMRGVRCRSLRLGLVTLRFLLATLPHLGRATRGQIAHVQGQFAWGLYAPTVGLLDRTARRVLFSPHNAFVRSGPSWQSRSLRFALAQADLVVCFSTPDLRKLRDLGARTLCQVPLVLFMPQPDPSSVGAWRERLGGSPDRAVFLLAGQIRPDKGVRDFLLASRMLGTPAAHVVLGEDGGFAEEAVRLRDALAPEVQVLVGYLDLADFVAALRAADAVVAPYSQASSSAVVGLALRAGTTAIAYPIGGLVESGAVLTDTSTPEALAEAMDRVADGPRRTVDHSAATSAWLEELYAG